MMKTAIVTGATGFIGSALTDELLKRGVTVYAAVRKPELLKQSEAIPILVDFDNPESLLPQIIEKVDVFYHCAFSGGFGREAIKNYSLQLKNARYSCDAVCLAEKLRVEKFVLASTVNTEELMSFRVNTAYSPRYTCIYGAGKLAAELMGKTMASNLGMQYCVANIAMPYGEGNSASTLPNIVMEQLLNGESPKLIEGNNLYDLVYIRDVAGALAAIGESGNNFENYYVGHTKLKTFREWITEIRDVLSPNTHLRFGEYPDAPSINYDAIDLNKLFHDTGFLCREDFAKSIKRTAVWLKKHTTEV